MKSLSAHVLLALVVAAPLWASDPASPQTSVPGAVPAAVAQIGTMTITTEDLYRGLVIPLYQAEQNVYETEKTWIDQQAKDILFNQAARAAGLSRKDWEAREITGKVTPPAQKDLDELFKKYPQPQPSSPETIKQATTYLTNQRRQERETAVFAELSKKTPVQIFLKPPKAPRIDVHYAPDDPAKGPVDAPVTLLEFTDFQCPFCQRSQPTLQQVEKTYEGKIKMVARQYPLDMHLRARPAAEAALCANAQGKYWPYRDKLFEKQQLSDADFIRYAHEAGLDEKAFQTCVSSHTMAVRVDADVAAGLSYGVHGTPFFFINGRPISGAVPFETFKQAIDEELKKKS